MYDDLRKVLIDAQALVGWYALGEAIRLTEAIIRVVQYHRDNPEDEKARQNLLTVAKKTASFLTRMGNTAKPETLNELHNTILTIELET
jgi:hypothetical protein